MKLVEISANSALNPRVGIIIMTELVFAKEVVEHVCTRSLLLYNINWLYVSPVIAFQITGIHLPTVDIANRAQCWGSWIGPILEMDAEKV